MSDARDPWPAYGPSVVKTLNRPSLLNRGVLLLVTVMSLSCSASDDKHDEACMPDDADGVIDEPVKFLVTVTDTEFEPKILASQNSSQVTLILKNEGTTPHSLVVDCLPTPNDDGCPTQSCFPSDARIDSVEPGAEVKVVFESPLVEGIYKFYSDVPEDTELAPGQFIIQ